MLKEHL